MEDWVKVAAVTDVPARGFKLVSQGRFGIGLCSVHGRILALNNYCPHAGAPVCRGTIGGTTVARGGYRVSVARKDEILRCPWHGWEFDLATGESLTRPVRRIKTYPVTVRDGYVYVALEGADAHPAPVTVEADA